MKMDDGWDQQRSSSVATHDTSSRRCHKKLDTTALYTRVALKALGEVTSPLEHLARTVKPPA
jgi:hypothetical protein